MRFTKMQGLGNDYIYLDCTKERPENAHELARRISDRHFGVGSDGLICVCPSRSADFRMEMYNADGTQGEMCGNGIRCMGKYVYDRGMTNKTDLTIETPGGVRTLRLQVGKGQVVSATVDMGAPVLEPGRIPVVARGSRFIGKQLHVRGRSYEVTCVSMGNPHAVIFTDHVAELPLEKIGPDFENHERFPRRTNTEFVEIEDREHVFMRVWERGTGETLACGTGCCAVAVAGVLNGLTEDTVTVKLLGGELLIHWDREENIVYMTGPAVSVFEGEIAL